MSRLIEVSDPADPRLADYIALRDVQLRTSLESAHGLFLAEGEKVVRRAIEAGYEARSLLMASRWLGSLADVLDQAGDVPCYVADDQVIEQVTGFHVHRGALASLHRRAPTELVDILDGSRRVVVLEDLVDHANVGTVFRCAAAFGMDAVLLSPRCADPLYRRSIKVSMGTVFGVPWARMPDWYDGLAQLRDHGFHVLALTPASDAQPLPEVPLGERVAIVLGTEGAGLTERWLRSADQRVVIPIAPEVDSLNVAAAAAVACYVLAESTHSLPR